MRRSEAPPAADETTDKEWQQQGEFRSGSEKGDYVATGKTQKRINYDQEET